MAEAAPDTTERFGGALRRLILLTIPQLKFFGFYEYVLVSGTAGPNLTGRCTDPGAGMPDLSNVEMLPGCGGVAATWSTAGTKFVVGFVNADETRPFVAFADPGQTPATAAVRGGTVTLAGGGPAVGRVGDTVNAGYLVTGSTGLVVSYFPGTVAGAAAAAAAAAALTPPGIVVSMTAGQIASGSPKVTSG